MKQFLTILLTGLLLLGLAGCNNDAPVQVDEPVETEIISTPTSIALADIYLPRDPDERLALAAKKNKDAVAWLTIDGTTIDDAVFQSVDNDYYLRRDAYGNYSLEGCYYADYECHLESADKLSRNTVIYGHTFQGDAEQRFFAQLYKYIEDEPWAMENRYIKLSTSDAMLTFEVISAGEVDSADSRPIQATPTLDGLAMLAESAIERSVFDFGVDGGTCGQLLTLSTCTADYSTRLLVVARLISQ